MNTFHCYHSFSARASNSLTAWLHGYITSTMTRKQERTLTTATTSSPRGSSLQFSAATCRRLASPAGSAFSDGAPNDGGDSNHDHQADDDEEQEEDFDPQRMHRARLAARSRFIAALRDIFSCCQQLRTLVLRDCHFTDIHPEFFAALGSMATLESLTLPRCDFTGNDDDEDEDELELEALRMATEDNSYYDSSNNNEQRKKILDSIEPIVQCICKLQQLRRFDSNDCLAPNSRAPVAFFAIVQRGGFTNVRHFISCDFAPSIGQLRFLAQRCTHLQRLSIAGPNLAAAGATTTATLTPVDQAMQLVGSSFPELRRVSFADIGGLNATALRLLLEPADTPPPRIEDLSFCYADGYDNPAAMSVLCNGPLSGSLKKLWIAAQCTHMTTEALAELRHLTNLESLDSSIVGPSMMQYGGGGLIGDNDQLASALSYAPGIGPISSLKALALTVAHVGWLCGVINNNKPLLEHLRYDITHISGDVSLFDSMFNDIFASTLPRLRNLHIRSSSCFNVNVDMTRLPSTLLQSSRAVLLPALEHLDIAVLATGDYVAGISHACQSLNVLHLYFACPMLHSDAHTRSVMAALPKLRNLKQLQQLNIEFVDCSWTWDLDRSTPVDFRAITPTEFAETFAAGVSGMQQLTSFSVQAGETSSRFVCLKKRYADEGPRTAAVDKAAVLKSVQRRLFAHNPRLLCLTYCSAHQEFESREQVESFLHE